MQAYINPPRMSGRGAYRANMGQSIERLHLVVDGTTHALAPLETAEDLRTQVLAAARAHGDFLNVTADDGSRLNIFVTRRTSVTISSATVRLTNDTADEDHRQGWSPADRLFQDDADPFDLI